MLRIVLFFLFSGMLLGCGDGKKTSIEANSKFVIATSIKPIAALAAAVAGDQAEIVQLIPDNTSPHSYSFKPSDIKKLEAADVFFRISERMETMLNPVLLNFRDKTPIITLSRAEGVSLLPFDANTQKVSANSRIKMDFHLWTSPENALAMAKKITAVLSAKDASNKDVYAKNLKQFTEALNQTTHELKAGLVPYQKTKYIVFHNAWQYFANYFGLQEPITVSRQEGILSGAKTFSSLRKKIDSEKIQCVFSDYTVNTSALALLKEGKQINHAEIDILASNFAIDKNTYVNWLKDMSESIRACLTPIK